VSGAPKPKDARSLTGKSRPYFVERIARYNDGLRLLNQSSYSDSHILFVARSTGVTPKISEKLPYIENGTVTAIE
jgi:hypothetical protein